MDRLWTWLFLHTVMISDSDGHTVMISDSDGHTVMISDSDGQPVDMIVMALCRFRSMTSSLCTSMLWVAAPCRPHHRERWATPSLCLMQSFPAYLVNIQTTPLKHSFLDEGTSCLWKSLPQVWFIKRLLIRPLFLNHKFKISKRKNNFILRNGLVTIFFVMDPQILKEDENFPKREARDIWCFPLSGISGLSFDSPFLSPLLFFLFCHFSANGLLILLTFFQKTWSIFC